MKKLSKALIITILLLGITVFAVSAQGPSVQTLPGSGWFQASLIQNAGGNQATVTFTPIVGLGVTGISEASPETTTIDPGKSKNVMPEFGDVKPTLDSGYKGSAIVSSTEPIVAVGSVQNNNIAGLLGTVGGRAAAQYVGIDANDTSTTLYFPVFKNDFVGKTTTFYIQTVTAGKVDVTYAANDGKSYQASLTTTKDGQMATFSPSDAGIPTGCTNGQDQRCVGAATFTSSVSLAGVYAEHEHSTSGAAQILLATRGFTDNDFDTTVVNPVMKSCWKGRSTGVQIQNVSNADTTITVTLSKQAGSAAAGSPVVFTDVTAGNSVTWFPGNHGVFQGPFGGGGCANHMDEFVGSAEITSSPGNIVAIVNENDFAAADQTRQTVFAAFPKKAGTATVLFPLAKESHNGRETGIQIANVGSNDVTLSAAYTIGANSFTVDKNADGSAITVAAGKAYTFFGVTQFGHADYKPFNGGFGAVTVTATGTNPAIVGIAQESTFPAGSSPLDTDNYEGFNQ